MKEQEVSLNELARRCDLSIDTLRSIKNNPDHNAEIQTLKLIAEALDCSVKDLIDDESWIVLQDEILSSLEEPDSLFHKENINLLEKLLMRSGVPVELTPSSLYRSISIKSSYNYSPVFIEIYMRVQRRLGGWIEIPDYYVYVNKEVVNECAVNNFILDSIEIYAQKNNLRQVIIQQIGGSDIDTFKLQDYEEVGIEDITYQKDYKLLEERFIERGYTFHQSGFSESVGNWTKKVAEIPDEYKRYDWDRLYRLQREVELGKFGQE